MTIEAAPHFLLPSRAGASQSPSAPLSDALCLAGIPLENQVRRSLRTLCHLGLGLPPPPEDFSTDQLALVVLDILRNSVGPPQRAEIETWR